MTPKYRAWDKEKGEMRLVKDIHFGDDGSALTVTFEMAPKTIYYRSLVDGENGILMQFTGLHSKSGVEIYEGDVVLWNGKVRELIIFEDGMFQRKYFDGNTDPLCIGTNQFEVIGNIWENPELINQSN